MCCHHWLTAMSSRFVVEWQRVNIQFKHHCLKCSLMNFFSWRKLDLGNSFILHWMLSSEIFSSYRNIFSVLTLFQWLFPYHFTINFLFYSNKYFYLLLFCQPVMKIIQDYSAFLPSPPFSSPISTLFFFLPRYLEELERYFSCFICNLFLMYKVF